MEKMHFNSLNRFYNSFIENTSLSKKFVTGDVLNEFKDFYSKRKSEKELTDKAYKELIYRKISKININRSQKLLNYEINFSDNLIKKMRNDEDFQKSILKTIEEKFSQNYNGVPDGKLVITFTENGDEVKYEYVELKKFKDKNKDKSFWEIRRERQNEINKEVEEKNKKRKLLEKIAINRNIDRINNNRLTYAIKTKKVIEELNGKYIALNYHPIMKEDTSLIEMIESLSDSSYENIKDFL